MGLLLQLHQSGGALRPSLPPRAWAKFPVPRLPSLPHQQRPLIVAHARGRKNSSGRGRSEDTHQQHKLAEQPSPPPARLPLLDWLEKMVGLLALVTLCLSGCLLGAVSKALSSCMHQ